MDLLNIAIREKALELGYEDCGIVPLEKLSEYGLKMNERIQKVPQSETFYKRQDRLIEPQKLFPWAQSVVIVIERYGKYVVPKEVQNSIGKHYLFDGRVDENSQEFQAGLKMETFMESLGLRFANERKFGLVGLRWAAMKAGLGIIRRNNFFYTKSSGSWVSLQGWLIDQKLELIGKDNHMNCSEHCNRCIKACPSGSLSAPYTMSPTECISYLTNIGGNDLPNDPLSKTFGQNLYGCDICQTVCPMNNGKYEEEDNFPGLSELTPYLTPEKIMEMDEEFYRKNVQPKFFYINPDNMWKWKVNALNFMRNNYDDRYKPYILKACQNENVKIREMAEMICGERNIIRNLH